MHGVRYPAPPQTAFAGGAPIVCRAPGASKRCCWLCPACCCTCTGEASCPELLHPSCLRLRRQPGVETAAIRLPVRCRLFHTQLARIPTRAAPEPCARPRHHHSLLVSPSITSRSTRRSARQSSPGVPGARSCSPRRHRLRRWPIRSRRCPPRLIQKGASRLRATTPYSYASLKYKLPRSRWRWACSSRRCASSTGAAASASPLPARWTQTVRRRTTRPTRRTACFSPSGSTRRCSAAAAARLV